MTQFSLIYNNSYRIDLTFIMQTIVTSFFKEVKESQVKQIQSKSKWWLLVKLLEQLEGGTSAHYFYLKITCKLLY